MHDIMVTNRTDYFYVGPGFLWPLGFPYGEQIVGTITVVDTFLGVILGISNAQYKIDNPEE